MSNPLLISSPNIPRIQVVHEDERRIIREALIPPVKDGDPVQRLSHIAIKNAGEVVLGQHYHPLPEHFIVINGNPDLWTAPHDNSTNITRQNFPNGGHVTIEPGVTHAFKFKHGGDIISVMDGKFNPDNMIPSVLDIDEK